jgi:hypothetical protein
MIFSFHRSSGLHQLIRSVDKGMWAHVGTVTENQTIVEMTLDGLAESEFSSLDAPEIDVGVYRVRDFSEEDRAGMKTILREQLRQNIRRYNWSGVMRLFLIKRWGLPLWRRPTELSPFDLLIGYDVSLVGFA